MTEIKRSSAQTKEQLMTAALHLFSLSGYAGTSVKEIADNAGVNISLVSYHFGGKEGLYKACLESFVAEKINFLETRILKPTSKEDFKLRLRIFLEHIVATEMKNPEAGCIIRRDIETGDPMLLDIFSNTILKVFDRLIEFMKSGQDAGYIRNDITAYNITSIFMGSIHNYIHTNPIREKFYGVSLKNPESQESFINAQLEMFFKGVEK